MERTLYARVATLNVYGLEASEDWTGAEMWELSEESE